MYETGKKNERDSKRMEIIAASVDSTVSGRK